MVAGSGSEESALEELAGTLLCWTGGARDDLAGGWRSEEHTSELQSPA